MTTIEDIILQKDGRNISALRPYLPSNYVEEAADLILEHPGKVDRHWVLYRLCKCTRD